MLCVSRDQVGVLFGHLDFVENNVLGVGDGFVSDFGAVEVQSIIKKHLQGVVDVSRIQMELLPGQYIAVFLDDLVVKDRGNVRGIDMPDLYDYCLGKLVHVQVHERDWYGHLGVFLLV